MIALLPPWPLLSAFLVASFVLAAIPGPAVIFIVTRSLAQGRRAGLASVAGIALGNLGNALAAALGLSALFAASPLVFAGVKYAGALYLIYLGVHALRARQTALPAVPAAVPAARAFRDGVVVSLLNPKTSIFFAAFLPQFLGGETAPMLQSLLLGSLFVAIAMATDCAYALAAGRVAPALAGARGIRSLGRYAVAGVFIALGIFAALSGSRHAR